jgi:hypothetical protein
MSTRIISRIAAGLAEIRTECDQEHAYVARTGTPPATIVRGGTRLVALAEELRTLTEIAREAEKLEPRVLCI